MQITLVFLLHFFFFTICGRSNTVGYGSSSLPGGHGTCRKDMRTVSRYLTCFKLWRFLPIFVAIIALPTTFFMLLNFQTAVCPILPTILIL